MSYIITSTKRLMKKAIHKLSQANSCAPSDIRIIIYSKGADQMPKYALKIKGREQEMIPADNAVQDSVMVKKYPMEIDFIKLIAAEVDWFADSDMIPPFIKDALARIAQDVKLVGEGCQVENLQVGICCAPDDENNEPVMFLSKVGVAVSQLTFEYFLQG